MALSVALVGQGLHHAVATGSITQGSGFGEVAALGAAQLMRLRLPFESRVYTPEGFERQFYIIAKSEDGNVTAVTLNATPFEYDDTSPIARFDVTITAFPAQMEIWLEAHHSVGR